MTVANRVFRGDAVAIKQVMTVTPGDVVAGNTYGLMINQKLVEASGVTATLLCAAFVTAINSSTIPEFKEITASSAGGVLTLTSKASGVPFSVQALVEGFVQGAAIVITIGNQPSGGTFYLRLFDDEGVETHNASPAYNASAATLQGEMDTFFGAGNTLVTKEFLDSGAWVYNIQFQGTLANTAVPLMTISGANLTGGNAAVVVTTVQTAVAGTTCVQTVNLYGSATGGTRTFTVLGLESAAQAYNASTADVQTAVRAKIGNNVDITGTAGTQYIFTFTNDLAHTEIPLITVDESNITGGSIYADLTITDGAEGRNQVYYVEREPTSVYAPIARSEIIVSKTTFSGWSAGTWTLDSSHSGFDAVTIPFDATDDEIADLISAELGIEGSVIVTSSPSQINIRFYGTASQYTLGTVSVLSFITGGSVALLSDFDGANGSSSSINNVSFQFATLSETGAALAANATDAEWQAAIEAMAFCGAGNVTVTTLNINGATFVRAIEFKGALGGQFVYLSLTGGTDSFGRLNIEEFRRGEATGANEVVELHIAGSPSVGSLILSQSGYETEPILYNDPLSEALRKLRALPSIGTANLTATGGPLPGSDVVYTFGGALAQTDVATVTVDDNGLKVNVVMTTPGVTGVNEKVSLSLTGQGVWAGDVTLTVDSTALDPINYNATYLDLQTELDAALGADKGTASGGPWPESVLFIEYDGDNAETDMSAVTTTDTLKNGTAVLVAYDPLIVTLTTRATGPSHWNNPVNWANPAIPTEKKVPCPGDTAYFTDGRGDVLYGIVQIVNFTVDTANDYVIPANAHDFFDQQEIEVWNTGGGLPSGLAGSTTYYVRDLDGFTGKFRLSATLDGPAIDITTAGTGTQTAGVRLEKLFTAAKCVTRAGLPWLNAAGYKEYRPLYLQIGLKPAGSKKIIIGEGEGTGTGRWCIDTGADQAIIECLSTGSPADPGFPSLRWIGSHASNVVKLRGGEMGISCLTTESTTGDAIEQTGGSLSVGEVHFATYDRTGGELIKLERGSFSGVISIRG